MLDLLSSPLPLIEIGPLDFSGPFLSHLSLKDEPGILATLVVVNDNFQLLNVYSTAKLRSSALLELSYLRQNNPEVVVAAYPSKLSPELTTAMASLVWQTFA